MKNPWLTVPLSDYEQHMGPDHAQQLAPLSDLFAEALNLCRPKSVAILGVAGGNGLERIDTGVTERICAVDINPCYLELVRERFRDLPGLELHCLDLTAKIPPSCPAPVELCHAALIFEHVGTDQGLMNAVSMVADIGHLSVILQLPSETEQGISPVALPSIQSLREHFLLVDPDQLCQDLLAFGFQLESEKKHNLTAGKKFWLGIFGRVS